MQQMKTPLSTGLQTVKINRYFSLFNFSLKGVDKNIKVYNYDIEDHWYMFSSIKTV